MTAPFQAPARTRVCAHHPERPAHALCMSCRKPVCHECASEWDGINYCVSCLRERRSLERSRESWWSSLAVAIASAFLAWTAARVLVFVGVALASGL